MAILLGRLGPQGFSPPISQIADAPTMLCEVPEDACWPAHISVDNVHATAVVTLRWIPKNATGRFSTLDNYSRRLNPGEGYVWDHPPRNAKLMAVTNAAGVQVSMDMNWSYLRDLELGA